MQQKAKSRASTYLERDSQQKNYGYDYPYDNVGRKGIFTTYPPASQVKDRRITSNRLDKNLPDNSIHTCRYNIFTFLPKNILIQYSKISNIYFLILGVLQIIPEISDSEGQPTIWLPLFMINLLTAAKDLYEDFKRRRADQEENQSQVISMEGMGEPKVEWQSLRVGNIIRVEKNQYFPADVLLLDSSEPKGVCYLETKSLDGETNLKQKSVQADILKYESNHTYIENNLVLDYEKANAQLNEFNGRVSLPNGQQVSVNNNNFILRGCNLRNTKWAIGLVTYTGHDTKIMMNSFSGRSKQSTLESCMMIQIKLIFGLMMLICIFGGLYYTLQQENNFNDLDYLQLVNKSNWTVFFINFFSWLLILSNLVPISLLVTLEIVKVTQGIMLADDTEMVSKDTMIAAQVQSSSLNEELGQVQYVFSDKTGTLTCNIMEFKKLSVNGISYGEAKVGARNYIQDISSFPKVTNVDFRDSTFFDRLSNNSDPESDNIRKTLFVIAICHTIIIERLDGQSIFNASSPDELALINFAKYAGVTYLGTTEDNIIEIKYLNQVYSYQFLHLFEFNSNRKRMSVIVKDLRNQKIMLYTKGADSIILDRIDKTIYKDTPRGVALNSTIEHLSEYGNIGLRTLLLAERVLEPTAFDSWNQLYMEATRVLENRQKKMEDLQEELEVNLQVVGSTAIEDKLQDRVGETIDALLRAGIKVWVLTGDKIETAINIAFSCRLLSSDVEIITVDQSEEAPLIKALEAAQVRVSHLPESKRVALVMSGPALVHALKGSVPKKIMEIGKRCRAVICCRVSPQQKQQVVSLVRREEPSATTLAIGDGANDVNMITAAHVGVGIKGLEGAQASRASDYALGEFKLLRRLLFYHGRECYRRNCNLILFNFFKNILLVLPSFWFGIQSEFSGPTLYDNYTFQCFNLFFAAVPIIIYAAFDLEFHPRDLENNYQNTYNDGPKSRLFNKFKNNHQIILYSKVFWSVFLNATYQSVIITFFCVYSLQSNFINVEGYSLTFWSTGAMIFGLVVLVSNIKVLIMSNEHSIGTISAILGSMVAYFCFFLIVSSFMYTGGFLYSEFIQVYTSPNLHIGNLVVLGCTSLVDLALEWHSRWKNIAMRKINYIERLEQDIMREEDDIVFVPKAVSSAIKEQYQYPLNETQKSIIISKQNNRMLDQPQIEMINMRQVVDKK